MRTLLLPLQCLTSLSLTTIPYLGATCKIPSGKGPFLRRINGKTTVGTSSRQTHIGSTFVGSLKCASNATMPQITVFCRNWPCGNRWQCGIIVLLKLSYLTGADCQVMASRGGSISLEGFA